MKENLQGRKGRAPGIAQKSPTPIQQEATSELRENNFLDT